MFGREYKKKNVLGLDISDISLKLFEFEKKQGNIKIQAYTDELIPKDIISAEAIRDPKGLIRLIQKSAARPKFGRVTTPYVVASIPETKCFVKVIQMAAVSEEEAKEAIPWEAEAYIPTPIAQVYLDWIVLPDRPARLRNGQAGGPRAGGQDKMTVLITAAPRDYVDDYTRILKEAGLQPIALEIESQATARSLVSRTDETVLILDINTLRTSFIIYDQDTLHFTSSIPIAGNIFTESVAKAMGITAEEAEKIKRRNGLDESKDNGVVKKAIVPVFNNLISEIRNIIRFYEEHGAAASKISRILLSGGSSKLKHLPSFLTEKLTRDLSSDHAFRSLPGIKVELGNPWVKILKKRQVPPLSREDSLSYATAIGLALREEDRW